MNDCPQRMKEVPPDLIKERRLVEAINLVVEKFDPQKWKLLATHLGLPIVVESIDRECISTKAKLGKIMEKWSDKYHGPSVVRTAIDKILKALKVVGDTKLADDIELLNSRSNTIVI
uniref:Uncharacterized protein LOC102808607 n=1 Tax=Saccoglossus kowalevskii TaxID=10224 RepID=A0ABM0MAJ3_SACKO|nr:PREDICTED: uncharacterized protein LOC102808607 [Saccoglossus kowalevskii]